MPVRPVTQRGIGALGDAARGPAPDVMRRPIGDAAGSASEGGPGGVYADAMRVEVNTELCQGHNRCYALAPELFDVDDYGTAMVIGDGTVPAELEEKAVLAVANCPEYAITVADA